MFPDGSSANFGDATPTRVFPYGEAYAATRCSSRSITSGTGTAANYGCPAAGKTGTANNLANAWFVGYTPRMSTARLGRLPAGQHPDGRRLRRHAGGADLARLHGGRLQRLLRRLRGHPTCRSTGTAFFGQFAVTGQPVVEPPTTSAGTAEHHHDAHRRKRRRHRDVDEPVQQPDALPASAAAGRDERRLRRRPTTAGGTGGGRRPRGPVKH